MNSAHAKQVVHCFKIARSIRFVASNPRRIDIAGNCRIYIVVEIIDKPEFPGNSIISCPWNTLGSGLPRFVDFPCSLRKSMFVLLFEISIFPLNFCFCVCLVYVRRSCVSRCCSGVIVFQSVIDSFLFLLSPLIFHYDCSFSRRSR